MALPDSHPEKLWGFKARPAVFAISVGVRTWTRTLSLSFSPPSPPTFCFQLDFFAGYHHPQDVRQGENLSYFMLSESKTDSM